MPSQTNAVRGEQPPAHTNILPVMMLLGLSFWFFLGFPFANHNEWSSWMVEFRRHDFAYLLTHNIAPVVTFRPLGVGLAWLSYHLSGGSVYPIQIINYVLAVCAWVLAFVAVDQKRLFAVIGALAGGVFFSGYIYLFHIHGVFYSPLLLFIAALLWASRRGKAGLRSLAGVSVGAVVCALFHPFALVVYCAFIVGLALTRWRDKSLSKPVLLALLFAALVGIKILIPSTTWAGNLMGRQLQGFLVTFQMVELNKLVALVSCILTVLTITGMGLDPRLKLALIFAAVIASPVLLSLGVPIVILWIVACFAKAMLMREWTLVAILAAAAAFPLPSPSGSPTYAVFALMVSCWILCLGWKWMDQRLRFLDKSFVVPVLVIVVAVIVVSGRLGSLPGPIAHFVSPVMAEEKNSSARARDSWIMNSEYRSVPGAVGFRCRESVGVQPRVRKPGAESSDVPGVSGQIPEMHRQA